MRLATAAILVTGLVLTGCDATQAQSPVGERRDVIIEGADAYEITSQHTGRTYRIEVTEPVPAPQEGETFPALFVLDGRTIGGLARNTAVILGRAENTERAYVVSIGYETYDEQETERIKDLTHNPESLGGGDGAAFEAFLLEEVRPFVEGRYPVDPDRAVLAGHSLGGLFAATALANDPHAWSGYLIGSPALQFDPALSERLSRRAPEMDGIRIFIGAGDGEPAMVPHARSAHAALTGPESTAVVSHRIFEGERHLSVRGAWLSQGLRFVLPGPDEE